MNIDPLHFVSFFSLMVHMSRWICAKKNPCMLGIYFPEIVYKTLFFVIHLEPVLFLWTFGFFLTSLYVPVLDFPISTDYLLLFGLFVINCIWFSPFFDLYCTSLLLIMYEIFSFTCHSLEL